MRSFQVIIDVNATEEVATFARWQGRWQDRVVLSENEGCGCCVDIWQITGPAEAMAELPAELISAFDPSDEKTGRTP